MLSRRMQGGYTGSMGPRVTVGLDFGTTFSGFAYAHISEPSEVFTIYEWPQQSSGGGQPYCKTQTSLYYCKDENGVRKLQSWGWPALVDFRKALSTVRQRSQHASKVGDFVTKFKLHLASSDVRELDSADSRALTFSCSNLTTRTLIVDFLREISQFIMDHLKSRFGKHFGMHEVQWCLTVPAIWDDRAKQLMKSYAEQAELVDESRSNSCASPHPLLMVLEPEAAAVYCFRKLKSLSFKVQDKFLTADIGGGTVDIVVHQKLESGTNEKLQLKEVASSTGDLCGGTYVDMAFLHHLSKRICCLESFLEKNPSMLLILLRWWEGVKSTFDGNLSTTFDVPSKLANAWEMADRNVQEVAEKSDSESEGNYEEVEFTMHDLLSIFDEVVEPILQLLRDALRPFLFGEVKAIMVVGGFSGSPYLMKRIRQQFSRIVGEIVSPPDPGSAICQGAVMLGIAEQDIIISRICRKTYGIATRSCFRVGDPEEYVVINDDGIKECSNRFEVFVRSGDDVPVSHSVTHTFVPSEHFQKWMGLRIFSSTELYPQYVVVKGAVKEGSFKLDISSGMELGKQREIEVTMFFGRSSVEVTAKGKNFFASGKAKDIPVTFKRAFDH